MLKKYLNNTKIKKVQYFEKNNSIQIHLLADKLDVIDLLNKINEVTKELETYINNLEYVDVSFDFEKDLFIEFEKDISDNVTAEILYEFIVHKLKDFDKSNSITKNFYLNVNNNDLHIIASSPKINEVIKKFLTRYQTFLNNIGLNYETINARVDSEKFKIEIKENKVTTDSYIPIENISTNDYSTSSNSNHDFSKSTSRSSGSGFSELTQEDILRKEELKSKFFIGKVFGIEEKKYNNGKGKLFIISAYNEIMNHAVNIVKFTNDLDEQLKFNINDFVKFYGTYKKDNYSRDVISFQLISSFYEMADSKQFVSTYKDIHDDRFRDEFHLHTNMSVMDGVGTPINYFEIAQKKNIKTITITDHNSVQSFPSAFLTSKKFPDIKLNYGVEFDVVDDINTVVVRNPRNQKLKNAEIIFFDIEATGLSSFVNELMEFGAVKLTSEGELIRKQFFVKTKNPIPKHITNITNITDDDVKDGLELIDALKEIKDFIGDSILVAHNADYDIGFLNNTYLQNNLEPITNPIIDSLKVSWMLNPDSTKHRLGTLAKKYGIEYDEIGSHRADYDADVLYHVYENFELELGEQGIKNLKDFNAQIGKIYPKQFSSHVSVIAKNQEGLKDLFKLTSRAHIEDFNSDRSSPQIKLSTLVEFKNEGNILIGSACANGFLWQEINNGLSKEYFEKLYDYYEIFTPSNYRNLVTGNYFTEEELLKVIREIISLGEKNKIPVLLTGDVHYPTINDKLARSVYIVNKGLGGRRHPLFNYNNQKNLDFPDAHLKSALEIEKELTFLSKEEFDQIVINNPNLLNQQIEKIIPLKDKLYPPIIENSRDEFLSLIDKNVKKKYGKNVDSKIQERIDKELNSIIGNGYDIIYYLSSLAVRKSLSDGYLVGSRGSVGSSIIATLSEITEVNPLQAHYYCEKCKTVEFVDTLGSGYDLPETKCEVCGAIRKGEGNNIPFETFLGFNGDKVPDIDLNFSGEYQLKIHDYIKEILSEDNVFRAGTISTVATRTAYGYVKNFLEITENNTAQKADISYLSSKVEGTKRTTGQHPGGLIVVPNDMEIFDFTPINFPGNDADSPWKTTHFDFHSIHDNLLKLDFLGHLDPTVLKFLAELTGVDPKTIPLNDKKVLKLFKNNKELKIKYPELMEEKLGILGIPEFGTTFVRELVSDASPETFSDLVRISGLSHGTDVWLGNAKELIKDGKANLSEVISVRDDIMSYLIKKGLNTTDSFTIMEQVRKGNGITDAQEREMRRNKVPEWYIESCKKIKYMFPKAHATAYVIMAFRVAWYKINYPREYYAAFFTKRDTEFAMDILFKNIDGKIEAKTKDEIYQSYKDLKLKQDKTDKEISIVSTLEIFIEMLARGYEFEPISLSKSQSFDWRVDEENGKLIPPFIIVDGLGNIVAQKIYENQIESEYTTKTDFKDRSGVNKTQYQFFDEYGILFELDEEEEVVVTKTKKQKSFGI